MNIRRIMKLLTFILTIMLLTTGNAYTKQENGQKHDVPKHSFPKNHGQGKAWGHYKKGNDSLPTDNVTPEIDAAFGTNAIALLAGVLLLASERSRKHS